jgi:hypothetical protein
MGKTGYALELVFGIGFKIGFLIAIVGAMMMYMPILIMTVDPLLETIGFWYAFNSNPQWVRVLTTGLVLMGGAFLISVIKGWFDPIMDLLFFEDKPSKPKQF